MPEYEGMDTEKYIGLRRAAATLGAPAAWLKREADQKRVPCLHVGRRRMFDVEAVERSLTERANGKGVGRDSD